MSRPVNVFARQAVRRVAWWVLWTIVAPPFAHGATLTMPAVSAGPGATFTVPVSVGNASGIQSIAFQLTYPTEFLTLTSVTQGPLLQPWNFEANTTTPPGTITVAALGTGALGGDGTVVLLDFQVKPGAPTGAVGALKFLHAELNDGAIPATAVSSFVSVGTAVQVTLPSPLAIEAGQVKTVPIVIDAVAGLQAMVFEVRFDPNLLESVYAEPSGLTGAWAQANFLQIPDPTMPAITTPGLLTIAALNLTPVNGSGALVNLKLTPKLWLPDDVETVIAIENIAFNDGAIPAAPYYGILTTGAGAPFLPPGVPAASDLLVAGLIAMVALAGTRVLSRAES